MNRKEAGSLYEQPELVVGPKQTTVLDIFLMLSYFVCSTQPRFRVMLLWMLNRKNQVTRSQEGSS